MLNICLVSGLSVVYDSLTVFDSISAFVGILIFIGLKAGAGAFSSNCKGFRSDYLS